MPEKQTIIFWERGILGWSVIFGGCKDWPIQATVWTFKNLPTYKAISLLFFVGPLLAGLTRHRRALNLSRLIRQFCIPNVAQDWNIIMGCHSEGTATGVEALRLAGWPRVEALHLICGAMDADFERNGLNYALRTDKIGRIVVYGATADRAMKLEDTKAGLFFFGIKDPLGLIKPEQIISHRSFKMARNVSLMSMGKVEEVIMEGYGHSDCFLPKNFEKTMRMLV